MELESRVVVVTGAASGIGKATARACARAGAHLALVDLNAAGLKEIATELETGGTRVATYVADLSQVSAIRELFPNIAATHGRIDALANVAAVYPPMPTLEVTEDHWDHVLGINLRGVFFACQAAVKIMLQQGSGSVVNIASGVAFFSLPNLAAYSASKAGLLGVSRSFALETAGTDVRVNTVAPGPTVTEGNLATRQSEAELTRDWLQPDEIADAIVYFFSDRSRGSHGAILNVDHGSWMP